MQHGHHSAGVRPVFSVFVSFRARASALARRPRVFVSITIERTGGKQNWRGQAGGGVLWRKNSPANHVAWESILFQIIYFMRIYVRVVSLNTVTDMPTLHKCPPRASPTISVIVVSLNKVTDIPTLHKCPPQASPTISAIPTSLISPYIISGGTARSRIKATILS